MTAQDNIVYKDTSSETTAEFEMPMGEPAQLPKDRQWPKAPIRGVNLAGWLNPNKTMSPGVFMGTRAESEVTLADVLTPEEYDQRMARHYTTFVTQQDFEAIARRGFNVVRVQVPWHLFGESGPACGRVAGSVQWADKMFDWADALGIKILLVLVGPPGVHEVVDDKGVAHTYWPMTEYAVDCACEVLVDLARRYGARPSFLGLEPCDRPRVVPAFSRGKGEGFTIYGLRGYLRSCIRCIRSVEADGIEGRSPFDPINIFIPTCGYEGNWRGFMDKEGLGALWLDVDLIRGGHHGVVVDSPKALRKVIDAERTAIKKARGSHMKVLVGTWSSSLSLPEGSITPEGREAAFRIYMGSQLAAFDACEGWCFMNYKAPLWMADWDSRRAFDHLESEMIL